MPVITAKLVRSWFEASPGKVSPGTV
jgi:hypothetical protein